MKRLIREAALALATAGAMRNSAEPPLFSPELGDQLVCLIANLLDAERLLDDGLEGQDGQTIGRAIDQAVELVFGVTDRIREIEPELPAGVAICLRKGYWKLVEIAELG